MLSFVTLVVFLFVLPVLPLILIAMALGSPLDNVTDAYKSLKQTVWEWAE
jgi:hypothetical protein